MLIASLSCSTKHGKVQSIFEEDTISNKGEGSGIGIGDAWGLAIRNLLAWFLDSMSAAVLEIPGMWVAVILRLKMAMKTKGI